MSKHILKLLFQVQVFKIWEFTATRNNSAFLVKGFWCVSPEYRYR